MSTLRLEASDRLVRDRTLRALGDSATREPDLVVRCRACGATVARAGHTQHGPLFTSTWMVRDSDDHDVLAGGELVSEYGRWARERPESVIALIALPPDLKPDYPDLLVRCSTHGDAVLNRFEVLDHLRRGVPLVVSVALPRREYTPPDLTADEWERAESLDAQTKTHSRSRSWQIRWRGDALR